MASPVIVCIISELPKHSNIELYFNNLFTTCTLIDSMLDKGVTDTVRSHSPDGCPLTDTASLKKRMRGTFEYKYD